MISSQPPEGWISEIIMTHVPAAPWALQSLWFPRDPESHARPLVHLEEPALECGPCENRGGRKSGTFQGRMVLCPQRNHLAAPPRLSDLMQVGASVASTEKSNHGSFEGVL